MVSMSQKVDRTLDIQANLSDEVKNYERIIERKLYAESKHEFAELKRFNHRVSKLE